MVRHFRQVLLTVLWALAGCATTPQLIAQGRLEAACERQDGALAQWLAAQGHLPRWRRVPAATFAQHGVDAGADYGRGFVVVEETPLPPGLPFTREDDAPEVLEQHADGSRWRDVSGEPDAWARLLRGERLPAPDDGTGRRSDTALVLGVLGTLVPVLPLLSFVTGKDLISPLVSSPSKPHESPPPPAPPLTLQGRTARLLVRDRGDVWAHDTLTLRMRPRFQFGQCRYEVLVEVLAHRTDDPSEALDATPAYGYGCTQRESSEFRLVCFGSQRHGP